MKNKNKYGILTASLVISLFTFSCKKSFLTVQPSGVLGDAQMATPNGVREALIAAYSDLDGQYNPNGFNWYAQPDNWLYGSICGGDAHKGSDPGDQADAYSVARFEGSPTNGYFETKWQWVYDGISRSNLVLRLAARTDMGATEKANIIAQAHFLRGFYAFEARKTWDMVPWVDTSITYAAGNY
ncbi:MAG: RagB/SusD family nutrient uptake outer membrane protein, partial [Chitinophagaceae bacterium]